MTLGEAQREFTRQVGRLIAFAYENGYALTFGDAYRDPRVQYGHPQSTHRQRLAVDLNLFQLVNGVWLYRMDTESHRPLGEWWEKQHELARWGGRFKPADGNHYSFTWNGVS
jgi:hypothetical protein